MTRYDNFYSITTPIDHEKVLKAMSQVIRYSHDVVEDILSNMNVTVDNGNVFFYSRKDSKDRYFVEVKSATKTVKIILASPDAIDIERFKHSCQDQPENGLKGSVTQP